MSYKHYFKILFILLAVTFCFENIEAIELKAKDRINLNEVINVTLDFETYIGAYDGIEVTYNDDVLEYISGDPLKESLWYDTTVESIGINKKSYTFRGTKNGISMIKIKVKGATSADKDMKDLGDLEVYKMITVGSGYIKGDLNGDGKINATDAAMVLDRYKYKKATDEDIIIGDMNDDGKINATDAAFILDIYKNNKK